MQSSSLQVLTQRNLTDIPILQVLTQRYLMEIDLQELTERFGCQFTSFLGSNAGMADMAKTEVFGSNAGMSANAICPQHTLSVVMPWAERYFIMEAIDNIQPEAVREGAQSAYLELFGSRSWEDEWNRVRTGCATCDMLAVMELCYTHA